MAHIKELEDRINRNKWGSWCRLISSKVNSGFAAGMNIGISAVEAEAYVLLNSDTIIRPGAFNAFRKVLKDYPDIGLIAPGMENIDGEIEYNTFRYITPISEFMRATGTGVIYSLLHKFDVVIKPDNKPLEPQWVGFACVVIRKEVIKKIGLLDERFFMYFEDIDYCRRSWAQGWKVLYWPESRVVHLLGKSSGVTKLSNMRCRAPKYYYEARAHYFKKHFGILGFITANILWTTGRCIYFLREKIGHKSPFLREYECEIFGLDLPSNYQKIDLSPRGGGERLKNSKDFRKGTKTKEHFVEGAVNANPPNISLLKLLREDLQTYDNNILTPGFWAVASDIDLVIGG